MKTYIVVALIFNALDFVTGFIAAVKNKAIQSNKLRDGLFKKVGFITVYALAWLFDTYSAIIGLDVDFKILPIVIMYVVLTESVSIIENAQKLNPDLDKTKLLSLFNLKENSEDERH